jgi:hypothetical protein
LLKLKVPNERVLDVYKVQREILQSKISNITAENKLLIENTIEDILNSGNSESMNKINTIREILYFLDLSFVKMMAPEYKDIILNYK